MLPKEDSIVKMLSPLKQSTVTHHGEDGERARVQQLPTCINLQPLLCAKVEVTEIARETKNSSQKRRQSQPCESTDVGVSTTSCHKAVPVIGVEQTSSCSEVLHLLARCETLDTQELSQRVKDLLLQNNIGQRIFGQAVLGLTQGSVSDLLSHPKPWESLSLKGREPFIKMKLWMSNPNNISALKSLKMEKANENNSKYSPVKKKSRVVLSMEEKLVLLRAYAVEPYPTQSTIEKLAEKLQKKSSTIVNWFHNYRSRMKHGCSHPVVGCSRRFASLKRPPEDLFKACVKNATLADTSSMKTS